MPRNGSPPPRGSFVYEHMTPELQAYLDLIQDRPDFKVDPEAYRAWRAEAVQALSLMQDEHHAYVDALHAYVDALLAKMEEAISTHDLSVYEKMLKLQASEFTRDGIMYSDEAVDRIQSQILAQAPPDAPRLDGAWTCEIETSSEVVGLPDNGGCSEKSDVE